MKPILFLTGPTGVGKTALSLALSKVLPIEIVSMDSMQIYRHMDIGTAKANAEQRARVAHHLIDILNPQDPFTVADYVEIANQVVKEIQNRGNIPLFVGGTVLYLDALLYGFQFGSAKPDLNQREIWNQRYQSDPQHFFEKVCAVDPVAASALTVKDGKKLVRVWEVYQQTGEALSARRKRESRVREDACVFVLSSEREKIYQRIDQRIDRMLEEGLIEENKKLRPQRRNAQVAMQAIGYKEVQWYLDGWLTRSEMERLLKRNTRHYAKRQLTWLRREPSHHWLDADEELSVLLQSMQQQIEEQYGILS